ncbi:putative acetyltransferase EpsM [Pullulanibacillus camelliae]|uniref:Putative acetyltransferase EpsM n=1 Tax=Pullulanibacillus camelliae TaxID=1707096 RepID=A0A8J2VGU1_9BACL|nr:acetyltransferase [Pullulanibacillus camelliae]GGE30500.1 putative acetyltransferase EpsM [Pullulanibacillus camelliae]
MKVGIIGDGGHSRAVQEIILSDKQYEIIGVFDDQYKGFDKSNGVYFGPILSVNKMITDFPEMKWVVAIGDNVMRRQIVQSLDIDEGHYLTVIHPQAYVSPSAMLGSGTVVMAHAVINAAARVGKHAIINTGAIVEHDNQLEDFVHISPNTTLTGAVTIAEGTQVGAGATVIPNVTIGRWSIVGAGATVINDLPSGCTAMGMPAKVRTRHEIGGM